MNEPDFLHRLPRAQFGAIRSVTPITVGLSGATVYGLSTDSGEYIARLQAELPADEVTRGFTLHQLVSERQIAPRLEWSDESGAITVSARITGPPFPRVLADPELRPRAIGSFVDALATLHATPTNDVPVADPLAVAQARWREQSVRAGFPAWARSIGGTLDRFEPVLAADDRRVLSHNDLNPMNILWDGNRVWLIDWDSAGMTHPYYDLATFSLFMSLPEPAALALLTRQESAPISADEARTFRCLRQLATILYGTMFLGMVRDLSSVPLADRDRALALAECFALIGSGRCDLQTADGQAMMATALLHEAVAYV